MMMPGMIQQAMHTQQGATQQTRPAAGGKHPVVTATAVGAAAGGGLNFDELAATAIDPKQLVRSVVQSAGWHVSEHDDVWQVTVPVGTLRKETVTVDFSGKDDEGDAIISYTSVCGPASEKNAMLLLRYNNKMVHGAFAVRKSDSGEMIVVQGNQLASTADTLEVTRLINAIAWQADKVEDKLGGGDQN